MKSVNTLTARLLFALIFVCGAAVVCAAQGPPSVEKVEPPNWWAGHSINPVRVMIRGKNLSGARVEAVGGGLKTGLVRVNALGTYLFADVSIDLNAKPGPRSLRITTNNGMTDAPFDISAPLARTGR